MDSEYSLEVVDGTIVTSDYDLDLERAGQAAEQAIKGNVFADYRKQISPNTKLRQMNDLESFSDYLKEAGVKREASDLYEDANAWYGMNHAIMQGYVIWAQDHGYSLGTINVRLATLRKYCKLAGPTPEGAGVLDEDTLTALLTVKTIAGKKQQNVDKDRQERGVPIRRGRKKAHATDLTTEQALQLKKTSTKPIRAFDQHISQRDALMLGLTIEHALRCSEVVALNIECFNLAKGTVTFYREKTDRVETHALKKHTRIAAETYLATLRNQGRTAGPLFIGYQGRRISKRAVNTRIGELGNRIGVKQLSPHDLRHFWTVDSLRNGTSLDRVVAGGGWRSPEMALRYAQRLGIANEGVKITEE